MATRVKPVKMSNVTANGTHLDGGIESQFHFGKSTGQVTDVRCTDEKQTFVTDDLSKRIPAKECNRQPQNAGLPKPE